MRILTVVGTRPEAIKMAPLVRVIESAPSVEGRLCLTAQHREMLDQVLAHFKLQAAYDLNLMKEGQGLSYVTASVVEKMEPVLKDFRPDWLLVQGDTTTTFAAALAAFYQRIPVAHVEAGLRTGDIYSPWPEEMNRKLASQIASLHFAPTASARDNLLAEGVANDKIVVTGNTVIDALLWTRDELLADAALEASIAAKFPFLKPGKRIVLVTGHRRENFHGGLGRIFTALRAFARREDVQVVFPVHLNPVVQKAATLALSGVGNVHLIAPQPYREFVWLMHKSHVIVTDSGGVQEEAPSLGKPVLVTRDTTERPEAVDAGAVTLVGTDPDVLRRELASLLDSDEKYKAMSGKQNPYGDGRASPRILEELLARR